MIEVIDEQDAKEACPIFVTEFGIWTKTKDGQFPKAK
jgi:hypothetical protein